MLILAAYLQVENSDFPLTVRLTSISGEVIQDVIASQSVSQKLGSFHCELSPSISPSVYSTLIPKFCRAPFRIQISAERRPN